MCDITWTDKHPLCLNLCKVVTDYIWLWNIACLHWSQVHGAGSSEAVWEIVYSYFSVRTNRKSIASSVIVSSAADNRSLNLTLMHIQKPPALAPLTHYGQIITAVLVGPISIYSLFSCCLCQNLLFLYTRDNCVSVGSSKTVLSVLGKKLYSWQNCTLHLHLLKRWLKHVVHECPLLVGTRYCHLQKHVI